MRAIISMVISAALTILVSGCGTVIQGRHQSLRIDSVPGGATVEIDNNRVTTPAEITVPRRPNDDLVRFTRDGYFAACRFVEWDTSPGLMTLDIIPVAIPLLIDVAASARPGFNQPVLVTLDPMPPGYVEVLPPNSEILKAHRNGVDLCNLPSEVVAFARLRARFKEQTAHVIAVPGGGDLGRPYTLLGQVDANATGIDTWSFSFLRVYGFGSFTFNRYEQKESQAGLNEMLKLEALQRYGERVDAIVNISYEELPHHDMSATGIAVHFADEVSAGGSASTRLTELDRLLKAGAISRPEYDRKRRQILDGI